jgi:uncharacterized protein YigE (DUF2233 family)
MNRMQTAPTHPITVRLMLALMIILAVPQIVTGQHAPAAQPDTLHSSASWEDSTRILHQHIMVLHHRLDSLIRVNLRLSEAAHRRLTYDIFADSFRTHVFSTCIVNPAKADIRIYNRISKKGVHTFSSLAALAEQEKTTLVLAMNAGMYERNREAKGLLVSKGITEKPLDQDTAGYGNFYLQPNGVFALDSSGHAYVVTTAAYNALADTISIRYATQSGPMLVMDGKVLPRFPDGSPNRHIRNAIGITDQQDVVLAISRDPVTFFEMGSFMISQGCTSVLYLDGAISQAYMPDIHTNSLSDGEHLGPILVIFSTP